MFPVLSVQTVPQLSPLTSLDPGSHKATSQTLCLHPSTSELSDFLEQLLPHGYSHQADQKRAQQWHLPTHMLEAASDIVSETMLGIAGD